MKHSILAAALCLPLTVTAAMAAPAEFRGIAVLLTASGCGTDSAAGDTAYVRYTPSDLTGNPANTDLTFHELGYAQDYATKTGRFTTTLQNVDTMAIGRSFGPFGGPATLAQTSPLPTSTTDSTIFINMVGKITRWGDVPGCTVTFRVGLARRP